MRLALIFSLVFGSSAFAQDSLRDSEEIIAQSQLSGLLSGHIVEFFDGSKSTFGSDGGYSYTYTDDGPIWAGRYMVEDQSRVCVDFDNGSRRCDRYVRDGERLVLITVDGTRFPIRNRTVDTN